MALAALTACTTGGTSDSEAQNCRDAQCVALGERQQVWRDLAVTPLEVIEDSRCPKDVQCVWQGRVRLRAQLDLGHESITVEIDSGEPLRIHGGFLSITEMAPATPVQGKPPRAKDYRFGFGFAPDMMCDGADAATR
ncbi:MAG: hypothetical protein A3J40_00595 [Erythrobacter sp. RIFCSPHIGHO2_12_FULL_63_10]|nr:MAG: hypothetical protein A3J40_00595 [Erythrobacter sp. RIFCSPHIGHO2_12_FULL_63_10]